LAHALCGDAFRWTRLRKKLASKLKGPDARKGERGRRASDRGAYSRFSHAVREAEFSRFFKIDLSAERFSYERN
jgi:hypothetical protein